MYLSALSSSRSHCVFRVYQPQISAERGSMPHNAKVARLEGTLPDEHFEGGLIITGKGDDGVEGGDACNFD
jgi:hypothetical protein